MKAKWYKGNVFGSKKLVGKSRDLFRVRVSKVRIVYSIEEGMVIIEDIDLRGNIYQD